jgi:hypothetical protein
MQSNLEMKSKYEKNFTISEKEWVISLINTGSGVKGFFGGHAKIVVEGLKKNNNNGRTNLFNSEPFIAEYHIMEAERIHEEAWVPQALRNTQCKYVVLFKEDNKYRRDDSDYTNTQARSHGAIPPEKVMKMIENIKQEAANIDERFLKPDFQYAGKWCFYSYEGGHNCTTWAEEKLDIVGIGKHLITDSSKAMPSLHATSSASSYICKLL